MSEKSRRMRSLVANIEKNEKKLMLLLKTILIS